MNGGERTEERELMNIDENLDRYNTAIDHEKQHIKNGYRPFTSQSFFAQSLHFVPRKGCLYELHHPTYHSVILISLILRKKHFFQSFKA